MKLPSHRVRVVVVYIPLVANYVRVVVCFPPTTNQWVFMLIINQWVVMLVLNDLRVGMMLPNHLEVAIYLIFISIQLLVCFKLFTYIFFMVEKKICTNLFTFFLFIHVILYIDAEGENVARKRHRSDCVIQEEGCTPTSTYPSDISDLPWEKNIKQCTLKMCEHIYSKLRKYLLSLKLPTDSWESLEILMHSLSTSIEVYKKFGPTTENFVEVMRKIKGHNDGSW